MYYNDNTVVFFNGEWVKAKELMVSPYVQVMHYGSGVFEGIRSYATPDGTRIFKSREHYERLLFSAEKIHLKVNYSAEEFTQLTYQLLEKNRLTNSYIRPLVFSGVNMRLTSTDIVNVLLCAWEWDNLLGNQLLNLMTSSYQRPNPKSCHVEAKVTGHYVNSILATTEAKNKGYDEALLLDANGNVAEGPGANFFFEKDEVLYTSPLGNILPGITRATMFELCHELGFKLVEKYFTPEEVKGADSAFFTGTAVEVAGIGKEMTKLAQTHSALPYLLTIFVAIVFFIFGLYGLSADNKFRPLPLLKPVIFAIAGIYLLRGIGELIFDLEKKQANQFLEITYSLIAVFIGLLFLIGGLKKWKLK